MSTYLSFWLITHLSISQDAPCDCAGQSSSCLTRPSRAAARHSVGQCKHRTQESQAATEEKVDTCNEWRPLKRHTTHTHTHTHTINTDFTLVTAMKAHHNTSANVHVDTYNLPHRCTAKHHATLLAHCKTHCHMHTFTTLVLDCTILMPRTGRTETQSQRQIQPSQNLPAWHKTHTIWHVNKNNSTKKNYDARTRSTNLPCPP